MIIEPISQAHNRLAFRSGDEKMDRYIQESAHQAKRKGLAATFVAVEPTQPSDIRGYYALSSFLISGITIPETLRRQRRLPTHHVGATLLGRLAVAKNFQGLGIGTMLVADALKRAYMVSKDVGSTAIIVDPLSENAAHFYQRLGFARMLEDDSRMLIMMDTVAELLPGVPASLQEEQSQPA
jgi:GNAT superfamily N-acetyltransferase